LGVAAAAAAFTAGQVGSAAAEGKKKPPAKKPAPGRHGGLVNPADLPGEHKLGQDGYLPVTKFQDLAAQQVYADAADYRQKVSAYARALGRR
jgi:Spy/CpxP family protein refolding chaperone